MNKEELISKLEELKEQLSYAVLGDTSSLDVRKIMDIGREQYKIEEEIKELTDKLANDDNYVNQDSINSIKVKNSLENTLNGLESTMKRHKKDSSLREERIKELNKKIERSKELLNQAEQNNNTRAISRNNRELAKSNNELQRLISEKENLDNIINTQTLMQENLKNEIESIVIDDKVDNDLKIKDIRRLEDLQKLSKLYQSRSTVIEYDTIEEIDKTIRLINDGEISDLDLIDRLAGIREDIPEDLLLITKEERNKEIDENNIELSNLSQDISSLESKTSNQDNYRYSAFLIDVMEYDVYNLNEELQNITSQLLKEESNLDDLNVEFARFEGLVKEIEEDTIRLQKENELLERHSRWDTENYSKYIEQIEHNKSLIEINNNLKEYRLKILNDISNQRETIQDKISDLNKNKNALNDTITLKNKELESKKNGIDEIAYNEDVNSLIAKKSIQKGLNARNQFLQYDLAENFDILIGNLKGVDEEISNEEVTQVEPEVVLNNEEENTISGTEIPKPRNRELNESNEEYISYLKDYYDNVFNDAEKVSHIATKLDEDGKVEVTYENSLVPVGENLPIPYEEHPIILKTKKKSFIDKLREWAKKYKNRIVSIALLTGTLLTTTSLLRSCENEYEDIVPDTNIEDVLNPDDVIEEPILTPEEPNIEQEEPKEEIDTPVIEDDKPNIDEIIEDVIEPTPEIEVPLKSDYEVAVEVVEGKWGVNPERREDLENSGYDYSKIQQIVNEIMSQYQKDEEPTINQDNTNNENEKPDYGDIEDVIPEVVPPVVDTPVIDTPNIPDTPTIPDIPTVDNDIIPDTGISEVHLNEGDTWVSNDGYYVDNSNGLNDNIADISASKEYTEPSANTENLESIEKVGEDMIIGVTPSEPSSNLNDNTNSNEYDALLEELRNAYGDIEYTYSEEGRSR